MFRRLMIILLSTVAVGALLLWIASHVGHTTWWNWEGERLSFSLSPHADHCSLAGRFDGKTQSLFAKAERGTLDLSYTWIEDPGGNNSTNQKWTLNLGGVKFTQNSISINFGWFSQSLPKWVTEEAVRRGKPFNLRTYSLSLPLWAIALVFGAYPTISVAWRATRRYRRRQRGLCLHCGYDLTGNESGICPECGHKAELRSSQVGQQRAYSQGESGNVAPNHSSKF